MLCAASCIHIHTQIHTRISIHIYTYLHICIHIYYTYLYINIRAYLHAYIYKCTYIHILACIKVFNRVHALLQGKKNARGEDKKFQFYNRVLLASCLQLKPFLTSSSSLVVSSNCQQTHIIENAFTSQEMKSLASIFAIPLPLNKKHCSRCNIIIPNKTFPS